MCLISPGSRIRLLESIPLDPPVDAGIQGTVENIHATGSILVHLDSGQRVTLIPGENRFQLLAVAPGQ